MFNFIFIFHGFLAILTQLVIFRELSVLFYGNELFLGTFLSSWLLWVGMGSLFVHRLLRKEQQPARYFSFGFLVLCLLLPLLILVIRLSKHIFSFGEFVGPLSTVLFTLSIMSLLCFIIGGQFSLACAIASEKSKKGTALGRVYLYEALGSVIGGILFTYVLIGSVATFLITLMLSLACIVVSQVTVKKISTKSVILITAALTLLFVYFKIEPAVNRLQWRGYQLIQQREARNATITLVTMGSIKNVFVDGMLSASFPDPENYEPAAHWPLLTTVNPRKVLVVGDVSLGTLKEILKHNPDSVDFVVLDHSLLDMVTPYVDTEDILSLRDPRITVYYGDVRLFIKEKRNKYDTVIVNIQEVPNLKVNRFYTEEFYAQIKSILAPDGVLAISVRSSENYLSRQTRIFNASVYQTLKTAFKTIEIIPGDSITFLSSLSAIDMQKETIIERFNNRKISNRLFTPAYIEYKLIANRRTQLKTLLEQTPGVKINRDFRPSTYYYFFDAWLNKFTSPLQYLTTGMLVVMIGFIIIRKRKSLLFPSQSKECMLIFSLGFMSILLELILVLGFQIISGYVYWQMGILFAAFMSGLCLGAAVGIRFQHSSPKKIFNFLVVLMLAITGLSTGIGSLLPHLVHASALLNIIIFLTLLAAIGSVTGTAFVITGFLIHSNEIMQKTGSLYAADLWGAASGAMLSTNFIIPVFGLLGALNFSAVIGLAGLIVFLILRRRSNLILQFDSAHYPSNNPERSEGQDEEKSAAQYQP